MQRHRGTELDWSLMPAAPSPPAVHLARVKDSCLQLQSAPKYKHDCDSDYKYRLYWFTPLPPWGPNLHPYGSLMVGLTFP